MKLLTAILVGICISSALAGQLQARNQKPMTSCVDKYCGDDPEARYAGLLNVIQSPNTDPHDLKQAIQDRDYMLKNCFSLTCPSNPQKALIDIKEEMTRSKYTEEKYKSLLRYVLFLEEICLKKYQCPCNVPDRVRELTCLYHKSGDKGFRNKFCQEITWIKRNCLYDQFKCSKAPLKDVEYILYRLRTRSDSPSNVKKEHCLVRWLRANCFELSEVDIPKDDSN